MVDILKGNKPDGLPVQQIAKIESTGLPLIADAMDHFRRPTFKLVAQPAKLLPMCCPALPIAMAAVNNYMI
jgi:hypothetical protein